MQIKVYRYKVGTFKEPKIDPFDFGNPHNLIQGQFNKFIVIIIEDNEIIRTFNFYTNNNMFGLENKSNYYTTIEELLERCTGLTNIIMHCIIEQYNEYQ
jgi:hypothetical protein